MATDAIQAPDATPPVPTYVDLRQNDVSPDQIPEGYRLSAEPEAARESADSVESVMADIAARDTAMYAEEMAARDKPYAPLAYLRGAVRPTLEHVLKAWDAKREAMLADPNRRVLNAMGLREAEDRHWAARDAAVEKVAQTLVAKLDAAESRARIEYERALSVPVTERDTVQALTLAQKLGLAGPAHGLPILAQFVRDAVEDRAALFEALPMLKALYDREDTPWTRHVGLLRMIRAGEALFDSVPQRVAAHNLKRIERTRGDLEMFLAAARERDPRARGAMNMLDVTSGEARYVLFPDEEALAPPPEPGRKAKYEPVRRVRLTPEQRAAAKKRRDEQD